jgi:EmrB/QacA subfamily drug resistance transporter
MAVVMARTDHGPGGRGADNLSERRWRVLGATAIGAFIAPFDGSVVAIALPKIGPALHLSFVGALWVQLIYLLVLTVALIPAGRLADAWGGLRLYRIGLVVFALASAAAGLSTSTEWLLAARCIQGLGAALLSATSTALVTEAFPRSERGKALGLNVTAVYLGLALGPALGGLLTEQVGWRSIFYVNVPVAAAALLLAYRILPPMAASGREESFDFAGAASFAVGMVGLLLGVDLAPDHGWGSAAALVPMLLGAGLLVAFVAVERRTRFPMTDLGLFRSRTFSAANLAKIFCYTSTFVVSFALPFYLEDLLGYAPAHVGLALLPLPIGMGLGSLLGGPLSDRIGSRVLAPLGMLMAGAGAAALAVARPAAGYGPLLLAMLVLEFGAGLFVSPNDSLIMRSAPADSSGQASGILALTRSLGMIFGITFAATVFEAYVGSRLGAAAVPAVPFLGGFHVAFAVAVGLCLIGAALSVVR